MFEWISRQVENAIMNGANRAFARLAGANPGEAAPELPEPVQLKLLLPAPPVDDRPAPTATRKSKAS